MGRENPKVYTASRCFIETTGNIRLREFYKKQPQLSSQQSLAQGLASKHVYLKLTIKCVICIIHHFNQLANFWSTSYQIRGLLYLKITDT